MEENSDYKKVLATGKKKTSKSGKKYIEFYASKSHIKEFLKNAFEPENKAHWTNTDGEQWLRFQMWPQKGESDKFVLKIF